MKKKAPSRPKGGKYAAELERLRELNAVKEVLSKSEIENAALTNTSKDSETISDSSVDRMLNQLNLGKNANKDLEIIESLAVQKRAVADRRAPSQSRPQRAKPKPKGGKKRK